MRIPSSLQKVCNLIIYRLFSFWNTRFFSINQKTRIFLQRISALFDANCPVVNQTKLLFYLVLDLFPAISSFSKENFLFKKEF